jgi:hypothetical protein
MGLRWFSWRLCYSGEVSGGFRSVLLCFCFDLWWWSPHHRFALLLFLDLSFLVVVLSQRRRHRHSPPFVSDWFDLLRSVFPAVQFYSVTGSI